MDSSGYWTRGGVAGTFAVTEDMERAVEVIHRAAAFMDQAHEALARQLGVAERASKDVTEYPVQAPMWRAHQSLLTVATDAGSPRRVAEDIRQQADAVARAAREYLEAERANHRQITMIERQRWGIEDSAGTYAWVARAAGAAIWAKGSAASRRLRPVRAPVLAWLAPSGPPPVTGFLNRNSVQGFMAYLDDPAPVSPSVYMHLLMRIAVISTLLRGLLGVTPPLDVMPVPDVKPLAPPRGLEDLLHGVERAYEGHRAAVGIHDVVDADGNTAHIVYIPGTETFDPTSDSPNGNHSNLVMMLGEISDVMAHVVRAMLAHGISADSPVMLVGHSQSGMTAMGLTASPLVMSRFNVTHVNTAGSPTGRMLVNPSVQHLAIESRDDLVSGADGASNPDLPNFVTVHGTGRDSADPVVAEGARYFPDAHLLTQHRDIAARADANPNTSVKAWTDSASAFLGSETATYSEYVPAPS